MTKSVESLKKTELEQLLQEQKSQKERLAGIESVLLEERKERLAGIESVLLAIQDKFGKNRWGPPKKKLYFKDILLHTRHVPKKGKRQKENKSRIVFQTGRSFC